MKFVLVFLALVSATAFANDGGLGGGVETPFPQKYFSIDQDLNILLEENDCASKAGPCSVWYTINNGVMKSGEHRKRSSRCQVFFFPAVKKSRMNRQNKLSFRNITLHAGETFEIQERSSFNDGHSWFSAKNTKPLCSYDSDTIEGVVVECRGRKAHRELEGWFTFSDEVTTSLFQQL